jgi:guanidinoacetate N-methyltransferase
MTDLPSNNKKKFEKSKEFLSQIPEWEHQYKQSSDLMDIEFEKDAWLTAPAVFSAHKLEILGKAVMEDWETLYMKELAEIATVNGGAILEIGFGMGISGQFIQEHKIQKHIIVEGNKQVAIKARAFAESAPHETIVLEGLWENVIDQVPDESIDGILFDAYPLTEAELYQSHFLFFSTAHQKLRGGGILTYYSGEIKTFGTVHMMKLIEAGFMKENIKGTIVKVDPPKDCEYWKANTILAPRISK